MTASVPRRLSRRAWLLVSASAAASHALGRAPIGGELKLALPWSLVDLDPHSSAPSAAWFGPAIADPLYGVDAHGRAHPALADGMPVVSGAGVEVRLRPGLVTARGRALTLHDVHWSLTRAATRGARALLGEFGAGQVAGEVLRFPKVDAARLALALASPLTAILPRGFNPARPDGTGALLAEPSPAGLRLSRNPRAARGAALLDRVNVKQSPSLTEGLRAFEAGELHVGWLGDGLHRPRPGARPFRGKDVGWVVLRTGAQAGQWSAPGVAQALISGLPAGSLGRFDLTPPGGRSQTRWGGGDAELLVSRAEPFLMEVAEAVAAGASQPGHRLNVTPVTEAELTRRRASAAYSLCLDFVRRLGEAPGLDGLALTAAASPALARRPPHLEKQSLIEVTRALSLGVIGAVRPSGYAAPEYQDLSLWDFGAITRQG